MKFKQGINKNQEFLLEELKEIFKETKRADEREN